MKTITFRKLRPEEIELRVGATTEKGFSLLLYKTARVDANILDETVGAFNWVKRFYQVKQTMICEIGINANYNDLLKEPNFIFKGDAGDESNTEAVKGEASDSFKRAGFAWGIGRELYTSPFIWINKDENNDPKKSHYQVQEIEYAENEISKLVIVNEKTGQVVFQKGSYSNPKPKKESVNPVAKNEDSDDENAPIREEELKVLNRWYSETDDTKKMIFKKWLKDNFKVNEIKDLTASQGIVVVKRLNIDKVS